MAINGEGLCLLGQNWLQHISLDWSAFFNLTTIDRESNAISAAQSTVCQEGVGKVEGVKVKIYINSSEKPQFFKARLVAYTCLKKLKQNWISLSKRELAGFSE